MRLLLFSQMGVLEAVPVLQPEMEYPIEAGVGEKNRPNELQDIDREQGSQDVLDDRHRAVVDGVLEIGAQPRIDEVSQHPDVRREKQQREPPPGVPDPRE